MLYVWLKPGCLVGIFCPHNYNVVRYDRPSRGKGIALFDNNQLQYSLFVSPAELNSMEIVCIDIKLCAPPTRVFAYYRPPGVGSSEIKCSDSSIKLLKKLCGTIKDLVLLGNFNLPDRNWSLYHSPDNIV